MVSKLRIIITTGDPDGIGWEVTAKALSALGPKAGVQFAFFKHAKSSGKNQPALKKFKAVQVSSLDDIRQLPFDPKTAIEVRSVLSPAHWVEEAAKACMRGEFHALVTAPLSKTAIINAGMSDIGHTEILARVTGQPDLFMGFIGRNFSVLLASGHRPLARALSELTPQRMEKALEAAAKMRGLLNPSHRKRPLAVVGINPHAGENGLIGKDEIWVKKLVEDLGPKLNLTGPLVPDAAFLKQNWAKYSVYVCPYHDQGLIPFKMVHGFTSGVHLTLGLPFVRTSVDHGTAKDLFGKNIAEAGSMKEALKTAIRLGKGNSL